MNKYLSKTKKILLNSCAVFSVLYFLFLLLSGAMGTLIPALPLKNSAVLFLFSFEICVCDLIFDTKKMKFAVKLLCHFFAVLLSALTCLGIAGYSLGYKTPIMIFVFLFIYALCAPVYILLGRKHKKGVKEEKQSEYVSIFKKD